jgi:hypothetical protein
VPERKQQEDFPCPCGRMTNADCAGECAQAGRCVQCGQPALGQLNGVPICAGHWDEVSNTDGLWLSLVAIALYILGRLLRSRR